MIIARCNVPTCEIRADRLDPRTPNTYIYLTIHVSTTLKYVGNAAFSHHRIGTCHIAMFTVVIVGYT